MPLVKEVVIGTDGFLERKQSSDWTAADIFDPPITFDGLGSVIQVGKTLPRRIWYDVEILEWCIVADRIGSIEIDILLSLWEDYPSAISIVGRNKPRIISSNRAQGNTAGWNNLISAGNILIFRVDDVSEITQAVLQLRVRKI